MGRRSRGDSHEIPLAPIERILRQEGGYRVSEEAARRLRDFIERLARDIARESIEMAKHAKRRTVKSEDVEMAIRRFLYARWVATLGA